MTSWLRCNGVHHLEATPGRALESAHFYSRLTGIDPRRADDGAWYFALGTGGLRLVSPADGEAEATRLSLTARGAIARVAEQLDRRGFAPVRGPERHPLRRGLALAMRDSLYLRDPDGCLVEVGCWPFGPALLGWYPSILEAAGGGLRHLG